MEIGVIHTIQPDSSENMFNPVSEFGLTVCQLCCWDTTYATPEMAERVIREAKEANVRICAFWAGVPGPQQWNFTEGPVTLGLVPQAYRAERVKALKQWADFAQWIGAPAIITHCGFIPENLTDPEYPAVVEAIREVALYCESKGIGFWFETGQETPIVLLRTIERVGTSNLGINMDPANLVLYGKGNPIDALDVFGRYVRNIHVKDGMYPTDGDHLGKEVRAGEGKVEFPLFMSRLKQIGFTGELIIEREISGQEQKDDIRRTMTDLQTWLQA
ncbi:sugar phosphate isomerase/epimerase family protein [Paenibacillus nasutitermitis]|uniref:Hexulose-6-phosphate isomerase n=1 Tax=Paenibacillus nasutitermitis TaxID=1652958 RepID=A0A916Z608_9BACL|nr:sugar phosphate isomerase/epimerase family protein [Paenibacillus nasutitermitis]GGD78147.1 hexulose-6-phosphate isomerase [Paenibacillus nasutitermitis]